MEDDAMPIAFTRWERRESTDRAAFGMAAYQYCRAVKAAGGSARFYWTGADSVAVLAESDSPGFFDSPPSPEAARAAFDLADLARHVAQERWIKPREGVAAYEAAGRVARAGG